MKVPAYPSNIKNDTITLNGTIYPILTIELIPGKFTDPLMAKFNWTVVDFTSKQLTIQLIFENMSKISATNGYPDSIKLTIYGVQYF